MAWNPEFEKKREFGRKKVGWDEYRTINLARLWLKGSVDGTLSIHDLEDPVHANGDVVTTYKSVVVVNKRNKPDVAHRCVILLCIIRLWP